MSATDLPEVRRGELDRAARIIGYDEVVMLGYRDSGMPDSPANSDPRSFAAAPLDEAVGRLVAVIRRTRPQVIVTYPQDQSGYPHPDHLRVNEISELAFDAAGDPDRYPQAGPPLATVAPLLRPVVGRGACGPSTRSISSWVWSRPTRTNALARLLEAESEPRARRGCAGCGPGCDRRHQRLRFGHAGVPAGPRHPGRSRRPATGSGCRPRYPTSSTPMTNTKWPGI